MRTNKQQSQKQKGFTARPGSSRVRRPEAPARLKAERVQLRIQPVSRQKTPGPTGKGLAGLPGWQRARNGNAIAMVREFADSQTAVDYAGFLVRYAAGSSLRIGIDLAGTRVKVSLRSSSRSRPQAGLGDEALEFARSLY